jgi:hypothetical protein
MERLVHDGSQALNEPLGCMCVLLAVEARATEAVGGIR